MKRRCIVHLQHNMLQLGHQAAVCPNGTIDWRAVYGDRAFIVTPPIYPDHWKQLTTPLKIDVDDIGKQAESYREVRIPVRQ